MANWLLKCKAKDWDRCIHGILMGDETCMISRATMYQQPANAEPWEVVIWRILNSCALGTQGIVGTTWRKKEKKKGENSHAD